MFYVFSSLVLHRKVEEIYLIPICMIDITVAFVHNICTSIFTIAMLLSNFDLTTEDDLASIPVHFTQLQSNVVVPKPKA